MAEPDDLTAQENVLPDDLSSTIESALDQTAPETDSPAQEGERQRDAFGRFAPREGAPAVTPQPATTTDGGVPTAGAADPTAYAPASWTEEAKSAWGKMPPELRGYMHQRDNELQAGFRQVADRASAAAAVINEFMPYAEILEQERASPVQAIRTLLQTAHALRTGGMEYRKAILYGLAEQYGVDMTQGYNPQQAMTEAQLQQLNTEKMQQDVQQNQRVEWEVGQAYHAFANDPKNEFFPHVRHIMAHIIGNGLANDLSSAYNMAVGVVPEVRDELFRRHAQAQFAEQQRSAAGANLSVSGAPGGGAASRAGDKVKDSDLRATIEAQLNGM